MESTYKNEHYNRGKQGKGYQGTCIKDIWTKPKEVGSRVRSGNGWSQGGLDEVKKETTVLEQQFFKKLKK